MDEALSQERAARRHALAKIENLIKRTPNYHIESADLKAASIRHLPLSLEADSQHHPRFFEPYQEELPLPSKEAEDELLEFEADPDHIMWDTRDLELLLTGHFSDCRYYGFGDSSKPPPSGVYREYVVSLTCHGY